MGMPLTPELALIAESVENANARVRFFRVAFGKASSGQQVNRAEIDAILHDISKGGRIKVTWSGSEIPDRNRLRAAFLAVMCLESALPLGGLISLEFQSDSCEVTATGKRIQIAQDLWQSLSGPANAPISLTAGQVQFVLLPKLLSETGKTAAVTWTETTATIRF